MITSDDLSKALLDGDIRETLLACRVESPSQRQRREELGKALPGILRHVGLTPDERMLVLERLNWYGSPAGLLPYAQVHKSLTEPQKRFSGVLDKVVAGSANLPAHMQRQLAEMAQLHRIYLEALRHETPDVQDVGRLTLPDDGFVSDDEQAAQKALGQLSDTQQAQAFWEAHAELGKQARVTAKSQGALYQFVGDMRGLSTDALRWRSTLDPNASHKVILAWLIEASVQKSLSVLPPLHQALQDLQDECATWEANGR